jgi:MFS family permease
MTAGTQPHAHAGDLTRAGNAVSAVFFGSGFIFTSWASRIPQIRAELGVSPGVLGLILLSASVGVAIGTPLGGVIMGRLGQARTVIATAWLAAAGMAAVAVGTRLGAPAVAGGLFVFGFSAGPWDVAANVQGAAVEQAQGRALLPRFHAGWSIGTVAGAGTGAAMVALGVPVTVHLLAASAAVAVGVPAAARRFLPPGPAAAGPGRPPRRRSALTPWTEPRTLLIGLFVLCMAFTEGSANDWLNLAVIDGYHVPAAVGTVALAVFLAAMTAGRWWGPPLIDRYGRVPVLRCGAATAVAGLALIEAGQMLPVVLAGAALMGLGTSLGFPVGISAAADDPACAPARVSTTTSIGYVAFLAGPPALGFLGDRVGVLHSLSLAGVMAAAAFLLSPVTAPIAPVSRPAAAPRRG